MPAQDHQFTKEIIKQVTLSYQLILPDSYEEQPHRQFPLILFLHGMNRRGDDLRALDQYGLPHIAQSLPDFEFIVLMPQCPAHSSWPLERDGLLALADEIESACRVDPERVYLTGFSMGGYGAWELAAHAPQRFAAIAPLAGGFPPERADRLSRVPIWAFHGEEDDAVPVRETTGIVQALTERGSPVRMTLYPGLKHRIMQQTYSQRELYAWFLQHTRQMS